ncbi:PREDICTED: uncharacterized protein LOC106745395 [Dinoponera quadriceps]|uniref:Uncharacterized protein LOC106745395 n=1 Tax=Dinoponera quadriceps TaxID=609295 RepID=A0A6P3XDY6_DINQU|nr:PREDICTED: uncharacterized protein LOC106745395 [Dinoponera quadriceps]
MTLPRRSIRHSSNMISDTGIETRNIPRTRSFVRNSKNISADKKLNADKIDESTVLDEAMAADDQDATPAAQTNSQKLSKDQTGNRTIRRTSARLSIAQVSNETHFKDISRRQSSLTRSQSQRNTPLRSLNINNKTNTNNRMIDDFFKTKQPSIGKNQAKSYDQSLVPSEIFKGAEKMRKIQDQVEAMKSHGRAAIKIYPDKTSEKRSNAKVAGIVSKKIVKKKKLSVEPAKKVDKAYLVNGKVYKAPRLPRPKQWVTDRFYKFMWKRMEPKYKLSARIRSEKFVEELNKVVTFISRCAKYDNYKAELEALMKEMARLRIINTPNDFYNFCRDFMPYEFRVKVIPILLPGNRKTIPYDPEKLHTPLLDE